MVAGPPRGGRGDGRSAVSPLLSVTLLLLPLLPVARPAAAASEACAGRSVAEASVGGDLPRAEEDAAVGVPCASLVVEEGSCHSDATAAVGDDVAGCPSLSLRQLRVSHLHADAAMEGSIEARTDAEVKAEGVASSSAEDDSGGQITTPPPGACTVLDQEVMATHGPGHRRGSLAKLIADCRHSSVSWWVNFDEDSMARCVAHRVGLSQACSKCWAAYGRNTFGSCRIQCTFHSWCSQPCLSCSRRHQGDLGACIGGLYPLPSQC